MCDLARDAVRIADISKALGTTQFPSDIYRDDYLESVVVRSPIPHGYLRALNTEVARQMPGVHAVLTAADIPGEKFFGKMIKDTPVLVQVGDRVRSVLDGLCLVAAETKDQAYAAAETIQIELDQLPAVFTAQDAMQPDSPLVHESGNIAKQFKLRHGNVDAGFAASDIIIMNTFEIPSIEHAFIETEAAFGEPVKDGLRVYVGSQNPYLEHKLIQVLLGLNEEQIEVIDVGAGGGFGGKDDSIITLYVALLTWATKKPVRMVWDRRESIRGHSKRHPMTITAKTGATSDGYLKAMQFEIVADTGSYAHWGPAILTFASLGAGGVYEIPNVWVDTYVVYTHNIMSGAMRAWGNQAIALVVECQVDQIASELGIHPLRVRWLNALSEGSPMASGRPAPPGVGARRTIEAAAELEGVDLKDSNSMIEPGVGFASVMQGVNYHFGYEDAAEVKVCLAEDDVFEIYTASSDLGQGLEAEIRLLFARSVCDLPIENTRWMPRSTATSPDAGSTGASRHTAITGNAVWGAGLRIRSLILGIAADMFGSSPDQVEMDGGHLWDATQEIRLAEVFAEARRRNIPLEAEYRFVAPPTTAVDEDGQGYPVNQYTYGTQVARVEVDELTGAVKVISVDSIIDAGQIVNTLGAEKQSEGGIVMGLGYALMEEFIREQGLPITDSLATFIIPTIADIPNEIHTRFVESPVPFGYLGARGLAELAMVPTAPAILNAIASATGVRLTSIPATPERVFTAMNEQIHKETSSQEEGSSL